MQEWSPPPPPSPPPHVPPLLPPLLPPLTPTPLFSPPCAPQERSPIDFPQEWITPQPSRRPDIFPEFEKLQTPLPKPMPGDPEVRRARQQGPKKGACLGLQGGQRPKRCAPL